ncbi:unnamed protein product [Nesidiocoris tenuis]|uniref:C2 domain-containing protein n=1 Tax=Nesidiocoris tenuis TaxID=355587 RepID=A0A6H5GZ55_9HEMI|nr:unnamed protein product [Nesidiocoris tenuis]
MPRVAPTKKPRQKNRDASQIGIFAVPDLDADLGGDDDLDDDEDLEAELNAILASGPPKPKPKKSLPQPAPTVNLDKMVAESMRDIPSDEDLSGDEDDPALLAELQAVSGLDQEPEDEPPKILQPVSSSSLDTLKLLDERIAMYMQAEENSKAVGDTMKVRRLQRGLKTLTELVKKAQSGAVIDEADIPMPVSIAAKKPQEDATAERQPEIFDPIDIDTGLPAPLLPQRAAPPAPPPRPSVAMATAQPLAPVSDVSDTSSSIVPIDQEVMKILTERRDQYKRAAVTAKRSGNTADALGFVKIAKKFDSVIQEATLGRPVDLSTMPPPPPGPNESNTPVAPPTPVPAPAEPPTQTSSPAMPDSGIEAEPRELRPPPPATVMEALEQRLSKFKEQEENAKKEGNTSKVRRMGRIVKQYQDAIKLHKAGKPIPVDELPTPPGYAPIPVPGAPQAAAPQAPPPDRPSGPAPSVSPAPRPAPPSTPKPEGPSTSPQQPLTKAETRQDKQMRLLIQKQQQFKDAALKAKQSGDLQLAKEYLRQYKCFDPLVEATKNGIPVDMSTLPAPPGSSKAIEKEFEIVKMEDCIPGSTSEIYNQLITDLQQQLKLCMETRTHFKAIGDVASANKFEQLAITSKKDLDTVKIACNKDAPVPKFHYERRTFEIVRCNTDLTDSELEIHIIQGVNYNVPNPKEIDTYIKFEFPAASNEEPKRDKTSTVYNTNNPAYDAKFVLTIPRNNRAFQRLFKRHSLKLEIWSKGGFLRSDSLVGTVSIKLLPLETKCTIHDSFDVMDGRRPLGGKLEAKIRLRHPIQTKQVEQLQEKWCVVDL